MNSRGILTSLAILCVPAAASCSEEATGDLSETTDQVQADDTGSPSQTTRENGGGNLEDQAEADGGSGAETEDDAAVSQDSNYVSGPQRSGELQIDATTIAYLYHRMSGEPASVVSMMTRPTRQRFDDEFARRRFVEEQHPEFLRTVDRSVSAQRYIVQINGRLESYDFERGGFPINGLYDRTFLSFNGSSSGSEGMDYSLSLGNTSELDFVEVSREDAEALNLGNGARRVDLMVEFVPIQAGWAKPRDEIFRTVDAIATRLDVVTPDGDVIATKEAVTQAPDGPLRIYAENPFAEPEFSNPWSAENAPEAVLDRYSWIVDERWRMPNIRMETGDSFYNAMSLSGAAASGCVANFGFSECQRLASARSEFIDRCVRDLPPGQSSDCYAISEFPYTALEADAR